MTAHRPEAGWTAPPSHDPSDHPNRNFRASGRHRHGWLMIACCVPMIAIAIALVAIGVVSPGFLLVALGCTAMMALMMRGMHGRQDDSPAVPPTRRREH